MNKSLKALIVFLFLAAIYSCQKSSEQKLFESCVKSLGSKNNDLSKTLCECQSKQMINSTILSKNIIKQLEADWNKGRSYSNNDEKEKMINEIINISNICFKQFNLREIERNY